MNKNTYLATKPHFDILDGLRGVAAMVVVAKHLFETSSKGPTLDVLNHGYLAEDFFFILSGFVIGYAYDDRWGKMTLGGFFKRRLIRLHPMVIMGSVIGLIFFYFGSVYYPMIPSIPAWKVILVFLLGCTMLPLPAGMDIRGWQETYPLNGPSWSLMWEYVANILYALVFRFLPTAALAVLVCIAAFFSIDLNMNLNVFGLLSESHAPFTPIGGWTLNAEQSYIAAARLFYPFLMGLLLSRLGARIKLRRGFWWCSLIVAVVLCLPYVGSETAPWINGIYNSLAILVVFPLVIAMGAGSSIQGEKSSKLCKFLGDISFPLYITHFPFVLAQSSVATVLKEAGAPQSAHILNSICLFFFSIALAYACLKLYDLPVREWLTQKFRR